MRKQRKSIFIILLLVVISACMVGCSSQKSEKTKVVIWHTSAQQQEEALNDIVSRFNASQDKVEVIAESQPSSDFLNNVYTAVANGVGPDIIFNYASTASDYVKENKVVNLSEYFDLDELSKLVSKAVYDECTSFGDGNLYCLPLHSSGPVLFYDKALYAELGLSVPNTWDELQKNSQIIYEKKEIAGFGADSLTDLMQCLILQNGSGYIDVENKKIVFNNEITAGALEWYGSNVRAGYFTNEKDGKYFYNNFNAGLLGSFIGSCGCEEYIVDKDFGVAPIPQAGVEEWSPTWNRALIVFKSNKDREAGAVEFIKFFTNAENSAQWCMASGNISPYSYVAEIAEYQEFLSKNKALAVVDQSKAHSTMLPTIVGSSTVRNELERMTVLAIGEDSNVTEILKEVEQRCNEALTQN